jgi:DNA-3-methyladenine glycosylase
MNTFDWLNGPVETIAPRLLGCRLLRELNGHTLIGTIVEVEAYDQTDAASHSYRGQTPRTDVMFGPAGYLYVYFTYGMHYCANVVVGPAGHGAAVLIRAVEPSGDSEYMSQLRGDKGERELTNGPAKFCQAFGINKELNGHDLSQDPLRLETGEPVVAGDIVTSARIGISQAKDVPWRFYLRGNEWVSRP